MDLNLTTTPGGSFEYWLHSSDEKTELHSATAFFLRLDGDKALAFTQIFSIARQCCLCNRGTMTTVCFLYSGSHLEHQPGGQGQMPWHSLMARDCVWCHLYTQHLKDFSLPVYRFLMFLTEVPLASYFPSVRFWQLFKCKLASRGAYLAAGLQSSTCALSSSSSRHREVFLLEAFPLYGA